MTKTKQESERHREGSSAKHTGCVPPHYHREEAHRGHQAHSFQGRRRKEGWKEGWKEEWTRSGPPRGSPTPTLMILSGTGNTCSLTSRPTRSPLSQHQLGLPILWCVRRAPAHDEAGGGQARRGLTSLHLDIRRKQDKAARGPPRRLSEKTPMASCC